MCTRSCVINQMTLLNRSLRHLGESGYLSCLGHPGQEDINMGVLPPGTWCSQRQAVVQAAGFGGDEQVAEDAEGDDEGQKNHSSHRQTHERTETIEQQQEKQSRRSVTSLAGQSKK